MRTTHSTHANRRRPARPGTSAPTRRRLDRGAGLVEYALLVALIAMVCLAALQLFGVSNGGSINRSASSVVTASS